MKSSSNKKKAPRYFCPVHLSTQLIFVLAGGCGHCKICGIYLQGVLMPATKLEGKKKQEKAA